MRGSSYQVIRVLLHKFEHICNACSIMLWGFAWFWHPAFHFLDAEWWTRTVLLKELSLSLGGPSCLTRSTDFPTELHGSQQRFGSAYFGGVGSPRNIRWNQFFPHLIFNDVYQVWDLLCTCWLFFVKHQMSKGEFQSMLRTFWNIVGRSVLEVDDLHRSVFLPLPNSLSQMWCFYFPEYFWIGVPHEMFHKRDSMCMNSFVNCLFIDF